MSCSKIWLTADYHLLLNTISFLMKSKYSFEDLPPSIRMHSKLCNSTANYSAIYTGQTNKYFLNISIDYQFIAHTIALLGILENKHVSIICII